MLQSQTMQQRDQPGTALVNDLELVFDPRSDHPGRPRQGVADPDTLPRTTRMVGAWIEHEFEVVYESRSGLIALLHRLGLEHRKPQAVSRKLDAARQQAFIDTYEGLLKTLPNYEAVMFADAVHPTHGGPVGCWAPKEIKVAVDQTRAGAR